MISEEEFSMWVLGRGPVGKGTFLGCWLHSSGQLEYDVRAEEKGSLREGT